MKFWHSVIKEIKLASRSFYFYIEIVFAGIFLFLLLFVIPDNFENRQDEYIHLDLPAAIEDQLLADYLKEDEDNRVEIVELELDDVIISAHLYTTKGSNIYLIDDEETTVALAEAERIFAAVIHVDENGTLTNTYYLQGYESERLRNVYAGFHIEDTESLRNAWEMQEIRKLQEGQILLSDKENVIPSFLTFNGSLMGLFVLISYIFLDKKEGVIKAYAVTTSPVWQYLLSKIGFILFTSLVTSIIIAAPIVGGRANYGMLLVLLITSGFAASSLGLVLASYFDDIMQSFGMLYVLIVLFMLPNIAYFIPTWNPNWITAIPTYAMLESFKEILLPNGDMNYVLISSAYFLVGGLILFLFANSRFKKTLTI